MPGRETGESSQPRAMEQGERTQTAFPHETPSRRDVLRDQDAFSPVALPETSVPAIPGAIPFERRGEKRSAEQASLTFPSTVPESAPKKRSMSDATRERFSRQRQIDKLFGEGLFSDQAIQARQAALNRPDVREKHKAAMKAAMKRPEVKEKHQAAMKAAHNRPEVKEKHQAAMKAAMNRPEVQEKRQEAYMDKLAKARTDVFAPEELATANSTASQAIGGGKSYAWMNVGKPAGQA